MICKKVFFLAGLTLCVIISSFGQTVISARNGSWSDPTTWEGGNVPTIFNCTLVRVEHDVSIDSGVFQSYSLLVNGNLRVAGGAVYEILSLDGVNGNVTVSGQLRVSGSLIGVDGVRYTTSASNTRFDSASTFILKGGPKAYIPLADWNPHSTFSIEGFKNSGYVALAYSDGWRQSFGQVVYNCPLQTTFVDLNGHLRNIAGDFIVRNTNSNALRLSTTQRSVISVGGDFRVEGNSEVWLNTTADSMRFSIGGDFVYNSTSTGPSYFATRGKTHITVNGKFVMNTKGVLRFCSGSADSTGVRRATVQFLDTVHISKGTFIAPFPGKGILIFAGSQVQQVTAPSSSFNGNFDYHVLEGSIVDLGVTALSGSGGIFIKGHLKVGSASSNGALHSTTGNVIVTGTRKFYPGCTIEYNGSAPQFIGSGHPSSSSVNVICDNPLGISLLAPLTTGNFTFSSPVLATASNSVDVFGNIEFTDSTTVTGHGALRCSGNLNQLISFNGSMISELFISKPPGKTVRLTSSLNILKSVLIEATNNTLISDGYLHMISRSDGPSGFAQVGSLPEGSSILGDVTIERHMNGEGRIYRYISSPVVSGNVLALMDDFPVTGRFSDPSRGSGINSKAPSLFYFDESKVEPWIAFPSEGFASENILEPGRGYAAFIRNATNSTVWDVTGLLNQGEIEIPVQYSQNASVESKGWNLVGNPYPCAIDWTREDGWERSSDISIPFAIRDNAAGMFRYFDGQIGSLPNGLIAAGQAFWIRASAQNPSIKINEQAKSLAGAEFYRKQDTDRPDFLSINVEGNGMSDCVFIRERPSALRGVDPFDAVKLDNDMLSLSVLVGSSKLAISAIDSVSCDEEFFLAMDFARESEDRFVTDPRGSYRMDVSSHGLFKVSKIRINDHFLNRVVDSLTYRFEITSDEMSSDPHRFSIQILSIPENKNESISLAPLNCRDSLVRIFIRNGVLSYHYSAIMSGIKFPARDMDDDTLEIGIPSAFLTSNRNESIAVIRSNICITDVLDTLVLLLPAVPSTPKGIEAHRCHDDVVVVRTPPLTGTRHFRIFEQRGDQDPLMTSHASEFSFLPKAENLYFYISQADTSGCESDRIQVPIEDVSFPPLKLYVSDGFLFSNYEKTKWFLNDNPISPDSVQYVLLSQEGIYSARTMIDWCVARADFNYERTDHPDVTMFPVPVTNWGDIQLRDEEIVQVKIYSLAGQVLIENTLHTARVKMNLEKLPDGVFIAEVFSATHRFRIKFLKRE